MVSPKLETVPPGDPRDRGGKAQPAFACLGRIEADEKIFESH